MHFVRSGITSGDEVIRMNLFVLHFNLTIDDCWLHSGDFFSEDRVWKWVMDSNKTLIDWHFQFHDGYWSIRRVTEVSLYNPTAQIFLK